MAARILLVGAASDGPKHLAVRVSDSKSLSAIFGGMYTQRVDITPTQTYVHLEYEPAETPAHSLDGRKNYLYRPTYSGQNLDFGPSGGANNHTLDVAYDPYLGIQDLLYAGRWHAATTGESVWVARAGGEVAAVTVGTWRFEAIHAGARYNKVHITVDASGATLWGLEPNFPTSRYDTTDGEELARLITNDYEQGASPVVVTSRGDNLPTAGTYLLSGGADGELNENTVTDFLDAMTLPSEVTHVVFLAQATAGMVTQVAEWLDSVNTQPRMFFFASPTYTSPASSWVNTMATTLPERMSLLSLVVGEVQTSLDAVDRTRYAVEAAAQAIASDPGATLTNAGTKAVGFSPRFTEAELDRLKAAGFMTLYRSISKDISVYEAVTSANDTSFLYSSKLVEITAIAYTYCLQFVGRPATQGDQPAIAQSLLQQLSIVDYVTFESVAVRVERDVMIVTIVVLLPNEILEIDFQIRNN